jgi:CheY-like chemotaxis protein
MKPVNFLLVEDDRIDAKAFVRAMKSLNIHNPLTIARDGVEAWELLAAGREPFPRPNILVLDINMPRMSGIELLRKIRADRGLRDLVVFVLTTSNDDQDKIEAYNLNVAGYMLKSDLESGLLQAVEMMGKYGQVVELPHGTRQEASFA